MPNAYHASIEGAQHGAKSLEQFLDYAKAAGVALNPVMGLDLAGGLACDSALVLQLCRLYGLPMTRGGARRLLLALGGQNAWLGGTQLGLQALQIGRAHV